MFIAPKQKVHFLYPLNWVQKIITYVMMCTTDLKMMLNSNKCIITNYVQHIALIKLGTFNILHVIAINDLIEPLQLFIVSNRFNGS